jgi:pimeloyl-ACP methyl ester carboxylesterase
MIAGARSALIHPGVVARVRAIAPPDTRFVEIPEAHHHIMIDQPLALVAALRALLA